MDRDEETLVVGSTREAWPPWLRGVVAGLVTLLVAAASLYALDRSGSGEADPTPAAPVDAPGATPGGASRSPGDPVVPPAASREEVADAAPESVLPVERWAGALIRRVEERSDVTVRTAGLVDPVVDPATGRTVGGALTVSLLRDGDPGGVLRLVVVWDRGDAPSRCSDECRRQRVPGGVVDVSVPSITSSDEALRGQIVQVRFQRRDPAVSVGLTARGTPGGLRPPLGVPDLRALATDPVWVVTGE